MHSTKIRTAKGFRRIKSGYNDRSHISHFMKLPYDIRFNIWVLRIRNPRGKIWKRQLPRKSFRAVPRIIQRLQTNCGGILSIFWTSITDDALSMLLTYHKLAPRRCAKILAGRRPYASSGASFEFCEELVLGP